MKKENKKILRLVIVLMILSILLTLGLFLLFQGDSPEKKQEAEQSSASDQTAGSDSVNLQPEETADTPQRRIATIVAAMSLEEKVGQLFFTRCPETEALQSIAEYHLGGYILFARDFKEKSPQQVIDEIEAYQQEAEIPLLIGVDEEGGTVNRISLYSQFRAVPFWSPRDLYQKGGLDLIRQDTKEKCDLLTSLGINVNLAPVCDVSTDRESYMYARTFGGDGEETAGYVATVVKVMKENNVGSVLKHFPGYGNNKDTHSEIVYDDRDYESFAASDFLPFEAGIQSGADAVLVSHNIVKSMDPDRPASLSKKVHNILRETLNFDGVIMTDDLYMDAIQKYTGKQEAAVQAVLAGNDVLCCTDFDVQIPAVIKAVREGLIGESVIDRAVERVLLWKYDLGIWKPE